MDTSRISLPVALAVGLVLFPVTPPAYALDLDFTAGIKGGPNGSASKKVPTGQLNLDGQTATYDPPVAGQFGIGGAFGAALELRAAEIAGLETGFYYSFDNASGQAILTTSEEDGSPRKFDQTEKAKAFHIPLMLKLAAPLEPVRPTLGLGAEFVIQNSGTFNYSAANDTFPLSSGLLTKNYTVLQATLGVEIDAGSFRIPVEFRAGYNPGLNNSLAGRTSVQNAGGEAVDGKWNITSGKLLYNGAYLAHFGLFTGISYRWDFSLPPKRSRTPVESSTTAESGSSNQNMAR